MSFFFGKRKKIGLALGGGAARGIAHIGVIKGLVNHKIPIDFIAGTSSGSLVGGLYAAGMDIDEMVTSIPQLKWRDFAGFHLSRRGVVSSKPIENLVKKFVGRKKLSEMKIPFSALATNILNGEGKALNDPNFELAQVIRASASFPGIYPPMKLDGTYYVDGGATANIPAKVVRDMGADVVIGVDVVPYVPLDKLPRHFAVMADRGLDLILHGVSQLTYEKSDIVLKPVNEYIHSFQVKKGLHLIELGFKCVEENIELLRKVIQ